MTRTLINVHWQMMKNTFRTNKKQYIPVFIIIAVFLFIFGLVFIQGAWQLFHLLTPALLQKGLPYVFLFGFTFILLFGIPNVFKHLYGSEDLAYLFTLPIATRKIFWIKFIQSFIGSPFIIWFLTFFPLLIYGFFEKANVFYFLFSLLISLSSVMIGLSFAYLFNLILIQILPASRTKELMTVMTALAGFVIYLIFQLPNMWFHHSPNEQTNLQLPDVPAWLPFKWGSDGLGGLLIGDIKAFIPALGFVLFAAFLMFLSSTLVEKGFRTGWIRLSEGSRKRKKKQNLQKQNKLQPTIIAIGLKEWRAIYRDMREWLTLLPLAFFLIFPFIMFIRSGQQLSELLQNSLLSFVVAQAVFFFMLTLFSGNFAAQTIAREGRGLWILRTMPLSGWRIVLGKLWISWLIPFALISCLNIILSIFLDWSLSWLFLAIATLGIISLGMSGIGIYIGTVGSIYNPNNPQQRLRFLPSLALMFLSFLYTSIATIPVGFLILPSQLESFFSMINGESEVPSFFINLTAIFLESKTLLGSLMYLLGFVGVVGISFGVTWLTAYLAAKNIDRGIDIKMVDKK
ncbi:putative ABC transporter permease subunit [Bacillus chungangensis]|uniref:ABC-2 type transport system permease protein n=1 Tax=Bacillus chungangensis TaxID=587633 RepID=A0ABT9WV00_9BACI|nr:hypothetical protein [Bacillus chungangensis]MDQ0176959.1 ABC-2 type transport system permease protein [Bacillus chungangensis]